MEKLGGIQGQVEKKEIELERLYKIRNSTVERLAELEIDDEEISKGGMEERFVSMGTYIYIRVKFPVAVAFGACFMNH